MRLKNKIIGLVRAEQEQQALFQWFTKRPSKYTIIRIINFLFHELIILFMMLLALPVVGIVRLLRPLILVRFRIVSGKRIAHLAIDVEQHLCELEAGMQAKNTFDIFYFSLPICNYQLWRMWRKKILILRCSRFAYQVVRVNSLFPGHEKYVIPRASGSYRDIHGLYARIPAHLSFSTKEEEEGHRQIRSMGVPEGAPFICFHVRDSAYLSSVAPLYNWDYHNYRDSNIANYIPAIKELTKSGYYAFRMGAKVKDPLDTGDNHMIIDYASRHRTEFLDIYLSSKCKFFIASNSGIEEVPKIFRRPVIYINFVPLGHIHTWWPIILFIPKKLWLRKERRFLSFSEILRSEIGNFLYSYQYEKSGIDVIENTSEEIKDVVMEMDKRLAGTWRPSDEDEELQCRFWSLFKQNKLHGKITARIGSEFLRQNKELLN